MKAAVHGRHAVSFYYPYIGDRPDARVRAQMFTAINTAAPPSATRPAVAKSRDQSVSPASPTVHSPAFRSQNDTHPRLSRPR